MKAANKALLMSALLFPGAGHYSLKKNIHFAILAGSAAICLYIIFSKLVEKAQLISEQLQSGEIAFDVEAISAELHSHAFSGDMQQINVAFAVLIFLWLFGIFDSYRLGIKKDKETKSLEQKSA